jgi:hypothetical protein
MRRRSSVPDARLSRAAGAGWVRRVSLAPAAVFAFANAAAAQQASPEQWQFYLTPYLWIAGVTGTVKTPFPKVPEQNLEAGFGDVLSHLDAIPIMGAAELRYGRFGVLTDIIAISVKANISTNEVLFSGGSVRLTQVIGSALGAYRVVGTKQQSLDLGLGVRAFGMATKFTLDPGLLPGFSKSPGADWADPIVAARYHFGFAPGWGVTAYGDVGGGPDSQFTWQLLGTLEYQITPATVMRIGYRELRFEYEGNVLHQNMGMSGPILGATIRF